MAALDAGISPPAPGTGHGLIPRGSLEAYFRDARTWQVLALSTLLTYGLRVLDFDQPIERGVQTLPHRIVARPGER